MRTITEKLAARLKVQAKEADLVGLKKLGSHLNRLAESKTRPTGDSYVYAEADFKNDVEGPLWDAIIRIADYYDCNVDPELMQRSIEGLAQDLVKAVSKQAGIKHGVGVFEPVVPGEEVVEQVLIEVE
ncbi:MAG: hypothetical protein CMB80_25575 [Flammeovirgaceae bacterium]|nr:hypothetical protein [Flammeovirgaceae bacterium]